MLGAAKFVIPPVPTAGAEALAPSLILLLPIAPMLIGMSLSIATRRKVLSRKAPAPNAMLLKRCLAASAPLCPALWISPAATDSGNGSSRSSLIRRGMFEDRELPFPESVAAGEIHKAGQRGAEAARHLFNSMAFGAGAFLLSTFRLVAIDKDIPINMGAIGSSKIKLGASASAPAVGTGGITNFAAPSISPAYFGVGYIIGPEL